ncbi:LOW QUALITY PROTEIN: caspase-10 [Trichechus manatus latirostris]|uniref:LOW QUALITY PROTEIN: caspase-10 n=1 Tax=Trichechus manatus latirostris TaxID=127582 RepID=A0A2Y9DP77_TRIMA|nr:LOW QUALITY PROTEIN: caspase-10 [Trichechus manatus latirostris]
MTTQGQGLDTSLEENCSMDFRRKLLKINEYLGAKDVEALKFLCRDLLSHKKLEKSGSALEIFEQLLAEEHLSEEDPFFLAELLYIIRQKSLLRHLQYFKEQVQNLLPVRRRVSLFRNLLYELSEDIDSERLRSMIFLLPNVFPKTEMTSLSFLAHLEKQDLIGEDNLTTLEDLCKIVAPNLLKKIEKYKTEKISQVVTPPVEKETEALHQEEEKLLSLLGNMQVHGTSQKEPWQNEHERRSNGDRATNGAPIPSSMEMLRASADIRNAATSTKEAAVYRMNRKHRGHCVIVNNHTFTSMKARPGTHKDAESLKCVFQWLGFAVRIYDDVTKGGLEEALQEYKSHSGHADGDCFVCCILTHGKFGAVYSADGALIPIRDIMSHFTAQQCPGLAHKPKLFFIQACQGDEIQPSVTIEADALNPEKVPSAPREVNLRESIPVEADFLLGLATVPGYVSFRHLEKGSWYIQSLCNHLKDLVPRHEDILSILTAVNNDVSRQAGKDGTKKQMPQPAFTLRKKLYSLCHRKHFPYSRVVMDS